MNIVITYPLLLFGMAHVTFQYDTLVDPFSCVCMIILDVSIINEF